MELTEDVSTKQYLTFRLGSESYSIDVHQVREVLDDTEVTRVPQTPDFMLGVINLRGSVVPVVDLRQRFGMAAAELTRDSCVIVMEIAIEGEKAVVGALVDAVEEVLDIHADAIEPPPRLGSRVNIEFLRGMGKRGEGFVMILDIDRIFSAEEVDFFHTAQDEATEVA